MPVINDPNEFVEYNNYRFGPYSHVTISAAMVEDSAQRTVLYHRYKMQIKTLIVAEAGDGTVGDHFRRMRQKLTKAGRPLKIHLTAFGPALEINSGGNVRDVEFGPKPRVISWDPVGATNAVEVIWECEFAVPVCDGSPNGLRFSGVAEFNYSIATTINRNGYTKRTISGFLTIAMTRFNVDSVPDSADMYREMITPLCPVNFHREHDWKLSEDRRRLDFTFTDTEIESPNVYPPGIIDIQASHRVNWTSRSRGTLSSSISANIKFQQGESRARAWEVFRGICQSRLAYAILEEKRYLFTGLSVEEELYENSWRFSLEYRLWSNSESPGVIASFFSSTGLGSAVDPAAEWFDWHKKRLSVQSPRGSANLNYMPHQDQIIDLCTTSINSDGGFLSGLNVSPNAEYVRFCNERPPPEQSWIWWDTELSALEYNATTIQISMGKDDLVSAQFDPGNPTAFNGNTNADNTMRTWIEDNAAAKEFTWSGTAMRVGYQIPVPRLQEVSGVPLKRIGKGEFVQKFVTTAFCQPIWAAKWSQRYAGIDRPQTFSPNDATGGFGGPE